jgi:hypothetical protein
MYEIYIEIIIYLNLLYKCNGLVEKLKLALCLNK